ncbi:nuclear transport factor 2 family protein [Lentiprolixibacter aurantiacus]|uniref:Nuclear transport factor 2 family protein n=1 Tax=Lentiprolixibacter aurantiacus TaxID=2993939 RepID=A0AAE3SMU1_9FLAO|nr:nuclear transport factor 2 family protein [Lentiprolixibacter aurantiacus]MCX2718815.1 nuclear transport factor 2 family protein [Lentiprolixibacter aurantiacus]
MKIKTCFLLLFLSIGLQAQETPKKTIHKVLDAWHDAAARADFEAYFNLMGEQSAFIGTDAMENWQRKAFEAFSRPYFDQGKAWAFQARERNIYLSADGSVAWFDELLDTWMGTCRGSGVLEKAGDSWKIRHYVLSITIPNEEVEPVIALKKSKDSLIRKQVQRNW